MEQEKDIVERLRENDLSDNASGIPCRLCLEAADEIERLRSQLADLESRYAHTLAHPSPIEIGRALGQERGKEKSAVEQHADYIRGKLLP